MSVEGFKEYKSREFCNDVRCRVQIDLNNLRDKPEEYEKIRQTCRTSCIYTTWQFHHWLIEKGYIILVSLKLKKNKQTVLANIDKSLLDWIDQQAQKRSNTDRSKLIERAIIQFKKTS